jgi:hypothetical protein
LSPDGDSESADNAQDREKINGRRLPIVQRWRLHSNLAERMTSHRIVIMEHA